MDASLDWSAGELDHLPTKTLNQLAATIRSALTENGWADSAAITLTPQLAQFAIYKIAWDLTAAIEDCFHIEPAPTPGTPMPEPFEYNCLREVIESELQYADNGLQLDHQEWEFTPIVERLTQTISQAFQLTWEPQTAEMYTVDWFFEQQANHRS